MIELDKLINRIKNEELVIFPFPLHSNNKLLIAKTFVDILFCYHETYYLDFDLLDSSKLTFPEELFISFNLAGLIAYYKIHIENVEEKIYGNPISDYELRYIMVKDGVVKLADKPIKITPFKIGFR